MPRHLLRCLLLLGLLGVFGTSALQAADIVERRGSDKRLSGEITSINKTSVKLKTDKEEIEIPVGEVVEISWSGEPAGLKTGRQDESAGRLDKALKNYQEAAAKTDGVSANAKTDIEYFLARTTAKMALSDPGLVDNALKSLGDFQKANSDSRHFYEATELQVELNLQKGDTAAARTAADVLAKGNSNAQKMAARLALGRIALQDNKLPEAQQEFEAVSQMPASNPIEESRKSEARLGLARCLQSQNKYDDAVKMLDEVIENAAPEDSRLQAEAFLRLGDAYLAAGKTKDALISYLYVDVITPQEKSYHPEALYQLSRLWTAIQQPERAADAADRLTTEYPKSPWTQKLKSTPGT